MKTGLSRDQKIAHLRKGGLSYRAIAEAVGLRSPERVRQILVKQDRVAKMLVEEDYLPLNTVVDGLGIPRKWVETWIKRSVIKPIVIPVSNKRVLTKTLSLKTATLAVLENWGVDVRRQWVHEELAKIHFFTTQYRYDLYGGRADSQYFIRSAGVVLFRIDLDALRLEVGNVFGCLPDPPKLSSLDQQIIDAVSPA